MARVNRGKSIGTFVLRGIGIVTVYIGCYAYIGTVNQYLYTCTGATGTKCLVRKIHIAAYGKYTGINKVSLWCVVAQGIYSAVYKSGVKSMRAFCWCKAKGSLQIVIYITYLVKAGGICSVAIRVR